MFYTHSRLVNIQSRKKIQTSTNERQVLEICIIFFKLSLFKYQTIGETRGMTDNRRVTEVFGTVNKTMIGKRKRKIGRGDRKSKTKYILNSGNDL